MRGGQAVLRLLCLCGLAGVLVAGLMSPTAIVAGLLSNRVSNATATVSAGLVGGAMPLVTTITDRDGTPIAYLFDQYRLPLTYHEISPAMIAAIVSVEDRRFYQDQGVDWQATVRAALHDVSGGGVLQGASTITEQYVKNYLINVVDRNDKAAQEQEQADTVSRKLREAKMGVQVSRVMPKNAVLTDYLDVVEFTGNIYGVTAAAHAYFDTTPDRLTVPQAALLAGMVNNPTLYDPYAHPAQALARRNVVIDAMVSDKALSAPDAATAKAAPLGILPGGPQVPSGTCVSAAPDAGFFCQYAVSYLEQAGFSADQIDGGGYVIKTTMDPTISQTVKAAVDTNVPTAQSGVANTFAVIAPGKGAHDVLAMVANRDYGSGAAPGEAATNIVADVSNVFGAGSSFKIFTTAAALEQGKVGLDTQLPDPSNSCFTPPNANRYTPCYRVRNDGLGYPNPISLRDALATSPNVAFVGLERQVGMPAVLQMAQRLGLRHTLAANDAGGMPNPQAADSRYSEPQSRYFQNYLSFTLGDSPVSPLEMANVSATLMSDGVWCPPNPILSVTDGQGAQVPVTRQPCQQVVAPALAHTLMAGLSQDTVSGTSAAAAHSAGWSHPGIGKTGTTEQSEGVAFVGGVDHYAVSSMVFADGRQPQELCPGPPVHLGSCGNGAFGGTVAAPPYFHAFNTILAGQPDVPLPPPDPAYLQANPHGPIVPYVIGQPADAATQTLQQAGYPVTTIPLDSAAPAGQVVGQTPQGTGTTGTTVTVYVSTGVLPTPQRPPPIAGGAPASTSPSAPGG